MKDVEDLAIPLPMLQKSTFVVRLNRFVGEITLDGKLYRAHVPSSGRMKELLYPGAKVYVSANATEGGKTSHRIVLAECNGHLVSIDSLLPNRMMRLALEQNIFSEFSGYEYIRPEAQYGNSRFDFYLANNTADSKDICYLEVKSVTLVSEGVALFPDAPSQRATKHLLELIKAVKAGMRGVVLFCIQREDANAFRPNDMGDPVFGEALRQAATAGVEVLARECKISPRQVSWGDMIPVYL